MEAFTAAPEAMAAGTLRHAVFDVRDKPTGASAAAAFVRAFAAVIRVADADVQNFHGRFPLSVDVHFL